MGSAARLVAPQKATIASRSESYFATGNIDLKDAAFIHIRQMHDGHVNHAGKLPSELPILFLMPV